MKTKRPKIEIGTTYPHFWQNRYVNAEVVSRRKDRGRWLWKVRLTESQQPIRYAVAETIVEFEETTAVIANIISHIESLPHYVPAPGRQGPFVVRYIEFPGDGLTGGLWCELRELCRCGPSRDTRWDRSEYGTVEALLASGDAVAA